MIYILMLALTGISVPFWPRGLRESARGGYWLVLMVVNRITGGFPFARNGVAPPVRASAWAALKRAGIKFPASYVTLPSLVSSDSANNSTVKRCNRYLAHQVLRLEAASQARQSDLFWVVALVLIYRSRAYRMAAIHKSIPFWYSKLTESRARTLIKDVDKLVRTWSTDLDLARKYIPKADGIRVRPLGVPALEWRVVITMWTVVLTLWLRPLISPTQFGATPGVGVASAWRRILENLDDDVFYEYDLKGFFNTIRLRPLHRLLEGVASVPPLVNSMIFGINATDPTPPEEGVHPSDPELAEKAVLANSYVSRPGPTQSRIASQWGAGPGSVLSARIAPPYTSMDFDVTNRPPDTWRWTRKRGIPQGLGWGPILSVFTLEHAGVFNPIKLAKVISRAEKGQNVSDAIAQMGGLVTLADPARADPLRFEKLNTYRWARKRIVDMEKWHLSLIQFIDDGLWHGRMEKPMAEHWWVAPEDQLGEMDRLGPAHLMNHPESDFQALGLEFSDKPGACGFVKVYGRWLKPLKFLGVTYDPVTDRLAGAQGLSVPREALMRILRTRGFAEFQRIILGMAPGIYGTSALPTGGAPSGIHPKSVWAKYSHDYGLASNRRGPRTFFWFIFILPATIWLWGGVNLDGGLKLPVIPVLLSYLAWDLTFDWWVLPRRWTLRPVIDRPFQWYYVDESAASTHFACTYLRSVIKRGPKRIRLNKYLQGGRVTSAKTGPRTRLGGR